MDFNYSYSLQEPQGSLVFKIPGIPAQGKILPGSLKLEAVMKGSGAKRGLIPTMVPFSSRKNRSRTPSCVFPSMRSTGAVFRVVSTVADLQQALPRVF